MSTWLPAMAVAALLATASSSLARASDGAAARAVAGALDEREQMEIASGSAEILRLLEEAGQRTRAGRLAEAAGLLASVVAQRPSSVTAARRHCELMSALGRRKEAIRSCQRALDLGGTARELRATVAALVSGAEAPTSEELFQATLLAEAAVRSARNEPWGYAARCDIAHRWGDPALTARCLEELRQVAPAHEETRMAVAALGPRTPWGVLVGWCALVALCLLTVIRVLRRAVRARTLAVAALAALVLSGRASLAVPAADPSKLDLASGAYKVDDANPEASVPTPAQRDANPLQFGYYLQDLLARAAAATEKREHAGAARYYRALAKAVPERATAFSKLCESLEAAGQRDAAVAACRDAVGREGVVANDYVRLARLLLVVQGRLAPAEIEELKGLAAHLRGQPEARVFGEHVACELAVRLDDVALLEQCTTGLGQLAPNDAKTISFQWTLAVKRGAREEARGLVARARQVGVTAEGLARMEQATAALSSAWGARLLDRRVMVGATALAFAGLALILVRRRRAT